MKRGAWHQLGFNHQKSVITQLKNGAGTGVILSPRDLSYANLQKYSKEYKGLGAAIILDPQWHYPEFVNDIIAKYPTSEFRASVSKLGKLDKASLVRLRDCLINENRTLSTSALVAPAVVYSAGRDDIVELNAKLHATARDAASILGIPCYGSAFLAASVSNSVHLIESALASVTSLSCDGWYFGFEFPAERVPSDAEAVYRCLRSALLLRMTGKPVLHAYAGPMGLLSFAAGCEAAASGVDKTQWRFCPGRWEKPTASGGRKKKPARYFSQALWGTIVFPDETASLSRSLLEKIISSSPFASSPLPPTWSNSDAKRHCAYTILKGIESVSASTSFSACRSAADSILQKAVTLHADISKLRLVLKDSTACYQSNWRTALKYLEERHKEDFDYLELLG